MGDAMVLLVTGASTGIGRAAAVELARRGAQVFGTMRDLARVGGLSEAAAASGVTVEAVELDVRSAMSVRACVDHVVAATGRLDVLVNNAAAFVYAPLEFTTDDELAAVVDTNLVGPLRTIRAVLPVMRRQGGGRIVNVGSVASEPKFGLPLSSVYGATKAALHAISLDLNKELAALGIDVVLCEGGIGGRTATTLALKLHTLGRAAQTLCITHLPQIAARGDVHFFIEKRTEKGRTTVSVFPLEGEARVQELARMLGGNHSETVLAHAREMLGTMIS